MMKTLFALSLGFAGLILATQAGFAGPPCAVRSTLVGQLAETYSETRKGMGMTGTNAVVELFVSEAGTWTVIVTMPSGMTCLVASGAGWETLVEDLPARGDLA